MLNEQVTQVRSENTSRIGLIGGQRSEEYAKKLALLYPAVCADAKERDRAMILWRQIWNAAQDGTHAVALRLTQRLKTAAERKEAHDIIATFQKSPFEPENVSFGVDALVQALSRKPPGQRKSGTVCQERRSQKDLAEIALSIVQKHFARNNRAALKEFETVCWIDQGILVSTFLSFWSGGNKEHPLMREFKKREVPWQQKRKLIDFARYLQSRRHKIRW